MKKGLNLINKEAQRTIGLLKLRRQAKVASMGIVGGFVVISLLVFLAFLAINGIYKNNEGKINSLKNEIKTYAKNESYLLILADRIKGINTLLEQRKFYSQAITDIESLSVPGFKLDGLNLNSKGDLKISGSCDSRESLTALNEAIEQISQGSKYSSVIYPSVALTKDSKYVITLELKK